ncbi:MAG TPA: hypothetical protein VJX16_23915 [Terriglobales bacterium]|nr:hypothetical protein [Terriglobales bacterium]
MKPALFIAMHFALQGPPLRRMTGSLQKGPAAITEIGNTATGGARTKQSA